MCPRQRRPSIMPANAALMSARDTLTGCATCVFPVRRSHPANSVQKVGEGDVLVRKMGATVWIADTDHAAFHTKLPTEPAPLVAEFKAVRQQVRTHTDLFCRAFQGQAQRRLGGAGHGRECP